MYVRNVTYLFYLISKPWMGLEGSSYRALCSPPLLSHLSDFAFDEELGVEEPTHWETPTEGSVDPEVDA